MKFSKCQELIKRRANLEKRHRVYARASPLARPQHPQRARTAGGMSGIVLLLLIVPILRHPLFYRFPSLRRCCHRISAVESRRWKRRRLCPTPARQVRPSRGPEIPYLDTAAMLPSHTHTAECAEPHSHVRPTRRRKRERMQRCRCPRWWCFFRAEGRIRFWGSTDAIIGMIFHTWGKLMEFSGISWL